MKIKNLSKNPLPEYKSKGASGMDLCANLENDILLSPMQRALIPTGIYIELPLGYEAQIRPRSGLALSYGITCLNAPGTIDSDYRGEIKVLLVNFSLEEFSVKNGDRIAQMIIANSIQVEWDPTYLLNDSPRGEGGFGSTRGF